MKEHQGEVKSKEVQKQLLAYFESRKGIKNDSKNKSDIMCS